LIPFVRAESLRTWMLELHGKHTKGPCCPEARPNGRRAREDDLDWVPYYLWLRRSRVGFRQYGQPAWSQWWPSDMSNEKAIEGLVL
jgi:hypothetical protein